jgi:hypothetical protein
MLSYVDCSEGKNDSGSDSVNVDRHVKNIASLRYQRLLTAQQISIILHISKQFILEKEKISRNITLT